VNAANSEDAGPGSPAVFAVERLNPLPEVRLVTSHRIRDDRGWLTETFATDAFAEEGLPTSFAQENESHTPRADTVRGLHYQVGEAAQGKLARCVDRRLVSVAVDLREGSPSYGDWVARELGADRTVQMWVPRGFAHGVWTLEDHTRLVSKLTRTFDEERARSLAWDDPALGIDWPGEDPHLSEKDAQAPGLSEAEPCLRAEAW
jgi:dTDP-4-dehydrorhamnose 3,5-epimerase